MISLKANREKLWFGLKDSSGFSERSYGGNYLINDFSILVSELKRGNFSYIEDIPKFFESSFPRQLRRDAMRLFCHVASHRDISFFNNYLASVSYEEAEDFLICAQYTLSPKIVPHVFELVDRFCGDDDIRDNGVGAYEMLFPFECVDGSDEISQAKRNFSEISTALSDGAYYYQGRLTHPGVISRELISNAIKAEREGAIFENAIGPAMLSVWSGHLFPIYYGEMVTHEHIKILFEYVEIIARMDWVEGAKYFYGNRIG